MKIDTMNDQRLHDYFVCDKAMACRLFQCFSEKIQIDQLIPIHGGMSTSNYCAVSGDTKYLLKIYASYTESIEPVVYAFLRDQACTPELLYYDESRAICPHPYAIIEFIDGVTLSEYVKTNKSYDLGKIRDIARIIAAIHTNTYRESGILDGELRIKSRIGNTRELIYESLSGKPGTHISRACSAGLERYLVHNEDVFRRIDQDFVLCHGDMSYGNILIAENRIYFIDFEYALAESRYRDLGKFFRNKTPDIQQYMTAATYAAFQEGYADSGCMLPDDWLHLSKIADIPVMLGLLNRESPPADWVDDIEHDIGTAIRVR